MSRPVPPGATVCVTGANGFVASHLVQALLRDGYRVRGTVRDPADPSRTEHLHALADALGARDRLSLVAADLAVPGSYEAAIAGCEGVFHCAAAVAFAAKDPQRDLVQPSVEGTRNVLEAARRAGTVRRFVHTSSVAAIYHWDLPVPRPLTEADWNTTSTVENDPYAYAKTEAEKAALAFVAALPEAERFDLVHLHPGMVWGPPMVKAHVKASPILLRRIVSRDMPGVPRLSLGVVDVREVAAAHVRAMAHPSPPPRCILVAEDLWMGEVAARIQALFPDLRVTTRVLPKLVVLAASLFDPNLNTRQLAKLVGLALRHDARLSREAYGIAYRPVDDTLRETVEPMIRNGWARVTRR